MHQKNRSKSKLKPIFQCKVVKTSVKLDHCLRCTKAAFVHEMHLISERGERVFRN